VAFVGIIAFVGLVTDVGSVYLSYGQLKRAVDAASVAAANEFKRNATEAKMTEAARELLALHNIDLTTVDLKVYTCTTLNLETVAPVFYEKCPNTSEGEPARKLVWVEATQKAPLYFLRVIGFDDLTLRTNAIGEAAPVDLVIVIDTSESMGKDTTTPDAYVPNNFDPGTNAGASPYGCNSTNTCQPLKQAKDAAKALIQQALYPGYDRVAVVTFDQIAITRINLSDNLEDVMNNRIDSEILLHDDAPAGAYMWPMWWNNGVPGRFNPVNPEDRDGDGQDADPGAPCTLDEDRWDEDNGIPCDADDKLDAYDWNLNGVFDQSDHDTSQLWINNHDPDGSGPLPAPNMSPLSTCTGCGMRMAANVLKMYGRTTAVWVIVFLSDGIANLSDTPESYPYDSGSEQGVPSAFPNGYCGGHIIQCGDTYDTNFWMTGCIDQDVTTRVCNDNSADTCPPGSIYAPDSEDFAPPYSPPYSVEDYARDMADDAALRVSTNTKEPAGRDIAIYSIGLGDAAAVGEPLLRYYANIGDDGGRDNDPCDGVAERTACGQYYFAPTGDALLPIFENIASRIYTRIAE